MNDDQYAWFIAIIGGIVTIALIIGLGSISK